MCGCAKVARGSLGLLRFGPPESYPSTEHLTVFPQVTSPSPSETHDTEGRRRRGGLVDEIIPVPEND